MVGGNGDRHTLRCPCTAGLGDPIAGVDDEGVVRVGPQLAHHHLGGFQAGLAWGEDDVGAAGQAQLRAGNGARAESGEIPRCWSALEYSSPRLDFRSHNALVGLHAEATVLRLDLGRAMIPREGFTACLADETLQAVTGVTSSSQPARGGPLQDHRGLVHHGDELLRR